MSCTHQNMQSALKSPRDFLFAVLLLSEWLLGDEQSDQKQRRFFIRMHKSTLLSSIVKQLFG